MSEPKEPWPADDPWWRFTPRNLAVGYLSLAAAAIVIVWSLWTLLGEGLDTTHTIFFVAMLVIGILWLVRATNGLKVLLRRRR
jgi:hypothetical protein